MSGIGIVPLKALARAKTRLCVAAPQRAEIACYMGRHVITQLVRCPMLERVLVIAGDDTVARLASSAGAIAVQDDGRGLGPMIDHTLASLTAPWALIAMADLPWLTSEDVLALVAALASHPVALAPDEEGTGTNALAVRLPIAWRTAFGTSDSFSTHRERAGGNAAIIHSASLAFDVDTPDHLKRAVGRDTEFPLARG